MSPERQAAVESGCWKVLLVDDEPEVHDASRLILSDLRFEGRDVELLSARSAAQAREMIDQRHDVALILLDVVMETDDAGIGLVQHIRERVHNRDVQIVLRTGQPGMAPERDVVLRYEINGYFLKTDITAQRLHSIVISALRNYRNTQTLRAEQARGMPAAAPPALDTSPAVLAAELSQVGESGSIVMHAQPEIVLASNMVAGIELVPQWKTSFGLLPASRVCEALPAGAARRRTVRWLLDQACQWARTWRASQSVPVTVSISLIGEFLDDGEIVAMVEDAVRDADLPRGTLDLLVGESTLHSGRADMAAVMTRLRAAGLMFTVADFGAQTISLQRLNQRVPDRLKIHRLFVRGVAEDPQRMALARSLIALAQTLNIVAIAAGISTDGDAQFFKWEGCDLGQGDALAPACALSEVAEFLRRGRGAEH